ncbi:unnamed protein product [Phytophthora fragariaefolia]|uniref:Unnamed protein product n=1 Tax=Phytophthora fragariaefolia TaxID=1490495 RepID=A0A9W6TT88_9STRA|nr:unnamed protein product [Phytophthora fragariaefolia]
MQPTPFFRKVTTNKDGRPRKQRKGWGRFQSVLRERSADFNLTLDVQNLRQEVQNLTTLRDILSTQSLVHRHSPEGSLSRLVNEYFHVFRKGAIMQESGRKRLVDDRDQRAFMHSMMDENVDVGNGVHGPDAMMGQMTAYTTMFRWICMTGRVTGIVKTDDSVLVSVKGAFEFQVMRATIQLVFPHIIGNEWLVAQLVGKDLVSPARSTFHFNSEGRCFKYDVDMDFVEAFTSVIQDPHIVDMLLGRALITDNALLGVMEASQVVGEEEKAPSLGLETYEDVDDFSGQPDQENRGQQSIPVVSELEPSGKAQSAISRRFCQRLVDDYFSAFAKGYQYDGTPSEEAQADFLMQRLDSQARIGVEGIPLAKYVEDRWRELTEHFEFIGFQQKGVMRAECDSRNDMNLIDVTARYILRLTFHSIRSVFPHVLSNLPLLDLLVGKVIMVSSELQLWVDKSTCRIFNIDEVMDFTSAVAELLPDQQDLSLVVSEALLTRDGVDYTREEPALTLKQPQQELLQQPSSPSKIHEIHEDDPPRTTRRTMRIDDILS